jgi:hypothetical protein
MRPWRQLEHNFSSSNSRYVGEGVGPCCKSFCCRKPPYAKPAPGLRLISATKWAETLLLTLGITRIIEQQSIDISIWGSADGSDWGSKPVASFPQKFYCGTYQIAIDLANRAEVRYLRAKWQVNRWGKGDPKPLFTIYLFAQTLQQEFAAAPA